MTRSWQMPSKRPEAQDLVIQEYSSSDAEANNLFAAGGRVFEFKNGEDIFHMKMGRPADGLQHSSILGLNVGGEPVEVLVERWTDISELNQKFAGIDIELLDDSIKTPLLRCLLDGFISTFEQSIGMAVAIESIQFGNSIDSTSKFDREVSLLLTKNETKSVMFNIRLSDLLLKKLSNVFEREKLDDSRLDGKQVDFDWYLEIGKTQLALEAYQKLGQFDIIFLDDCSNFQSKIYPMMGLNDLTIKGELRGSTFVVKEKI